MTKKTTVLLTNSNRNTIQDIQTEIEHLTGTKISMSKIINIAIKELGNTGTNNNTDIKQCINVLQSYNLL